MTSLQVLVIGAGYAGSCVVAALLRRRVERIGWVDGGGAKSSDVRVALVHPFAGRSFAPRPDVPAAWTAAQAFVASLGPEVGALQRPVHRHATDADAQRLERSLIEHSDALRSDYRDAAPRRSDTAAHRFEYDAALAFDMREAVAVIGRRFTAAGHTCTVDNVARMTSSGGGWRVELRSGDTLHARHVVVAAGVGSRGLLPQRLPSERFEVVEGALVVGPALGHASFVIAGGHLSSTRTHCAWGSSYAPEGAPPAAHVPQLAALEERLATHVELPPLAQRTRWIGRRLVDRNTRLPCVETLEDGLHVCTAFGSQAGLWAPWLAARLVDAIVA